MTDFEKIRSLLAQVSIFALIIAVWVALVTLWWLSRSRRRKVLEQRLHAGRADAGAEKVLRLWREGQPVETLVPSGSTSFAQRLEQIRLDTGWETSIQVILLRVLGAAGLAGLLVLLASGSVFLACGAAVVVLIGFRALLLRRVMKRS